MYDESVPSIELKRIGCRDPLVSQRKTVFSKTLFSVVGSSSRLLEHWGFLDFMECLDNLVDSLSGNLKISSDLCNRLPVQPLLEVPLNISIG